MLLHQTPFDEITEADLQRLVEVGASESTRLDFKQMLPLTEGRDPDLDASRRFCRDVSAFANTDGGDLVYGMREEKGEAVELNGLTCADQEKYKSKLEDILKDHVEPRIGRVRLRFVPLQGGRLALVLRVPRSLEAPHGVKANGAWDFYGRRSAGNYAMSVSEIRAAFTRTQDWREGILRWHRARVDLYEAGEGVVPVQGDYRTYVHVVPLGGESVLDVASALSPNRKEEPFDRALMRFAGWSSMNHALPTHEGIAQVRPFNGGPPRALALWTHDGRFEALFGDQLQQETREYRMGFWAEVVEDELHGYVVAGIKSLTILGIGGPYLVVTSLCGVKGATVLFDSRYHRIPGRGQPIPLASDLLVLPSIVIESNANELWMELRPILDRLAHAGGRSGSPRYTART